MKRIRSVLIVTIVMVGLVFAYAPFVAAKPLKCKAVAFLPVNNANVAGFNIFVDMVNEKFKDDIQIDLIGGPEVTPPFQLHEAVKSGVIDMCLTSCGYYPSRSGKLNRPCLRTKTSRKSPRPTTSRS